MDKYKEKIKFPFKCPVCGKEEFEDFDWLAEEENDDEVEVYKIDTISGEKVRITDPIEIYCVHCSHCGWMYDLKQVVDHDAVGDRNEKTVNELRVEYRQKIKANSKYNFDDDNSKHNPHKCPVCGEYGFKYEDSYDVCPICGWIDDGTDSIPSDNYSEVNAISIVDARKHFIEQRSQDPQYRWDKEQQKKKIKI